MSVRKDEIIIQADSFTLLILFLTKYYTFYAKVYISLKNNKILFFYVKIHIKIHFKYYFCALCYNFLVIIIFKSF